MYARKYTVSVLYFGSLNPLLYSPLPLYLPPPIFQKLSIHILTSSTSTGVMFYDITDALSFSCSFHPCPGSIEKFHYCKHVLHLSL
jgi:hypothetical protein